MVATVVTHPMLTNGFSTTTSLMKLVLFTKVEVGTTVLVALLCHTAVIAHQELHVSSLSNTTSTTLLNTAL